MFHFEVAFEVHEVKQRRVLRKGLQDVGLGWGEHIGVPWFFSEENVFVGGAGPTFPNGDDFVSIDRFDNFNFRSTQNFSDFTIKGNLPWTVVILTHYHRL